MRELAKAELDRVSGGKITTFQENPSGNRLPAGSNSQGQAIDTVSENPAGKQPPGQQHRRSRNKRNVWRDAMRHLTGTELDRVNGGRQTEGTEQRNNGGNVPNGNANGVPEVVVAVENPQGKRPPGQQP